MGFECGFNIIKKHNNLSPNEYIVVKTYADYLFNDWAKENYDNFESYYESQYSWLDKSATLPFIPNGTDAEFYYANPEENVNCWCSIGRKLDDIILPHVNKDRLELDEEYVVTREGIEKILEDVNTELESQNLKPVYVIKAWKNKDDDTQIMIDVEGLIVEDEYGNQKVLYADSELYLPDTYYDEDYRRALEELKNTLIKLKDVDLEKNWIFFYRSY